MGTLTTSSSGVPLTFLEDFPATPDALQAMGGGRFLGCGGMGTAGIAGAAAGTSGRCRLRRAVRCSLADFLPLETTEESDAAVESNETAFLLASLAAAAKVSMAGLGPDDVLTNLPFFLFFFLAVAAAAAEAAEGAGCGGTDGAGGGGCVGEDSLSLPLEIMDPNALSNSSSSFKPASSYATSHRT